MTAAIRATNKTPVANERERGRILLVTDDKTIAAHRATLEAAGFTVTDVAGGLAALVALRRTRPHAIVADTALRGITADQLARNLLAANDGVPLVLIGSTEATSALRNHAMQVGAFDYFQLPDDADLLAARLHQLVEVKLTIDRLRAEAERDVLTGLANRKRFRTAFGNELERWRRYNIPCALLMIDIDFLKRINDTHGHTAGDMAIRAVAHTLERFSRDNDTPARLGGEEFALLLAGSTEAQAAIVAERIRAHVAATPLENVGEFSVSIGVAACPTHADTERRLYVISDESLYKAKHGGRNRIVVASPNQTDDENP